MGRPDRTEPRSSPGLPGLPAPLGLQQREGGTRAGLRNHSVRRSAGRDRLQVAKLKALVGQSCRLLLGQLAARDRSSGRADLAAFALRWVRKSGALAGIRSACWCSGSAASGISGPHRLLPSRHRPQHASATRGEEAQGVAEGAGRRGASHAMANCGAGLLVLLLRSVLHLDETGSALLWAAYVGSFAAAASDTASSEVGQLIGKHPISPRTFRPVAVGTEGAVSLEGTLAGVGAAAVLAGVGAAFGLLSVAGMVAVTIGGFLGNFLESLAGSWGRKVLPHGLLNFANTAVGGVASALLTRVIAGP
ncbi:MAG: DUF92 domain-containing protein [Candidatus Eisenbacteria bacterium]